MQLQLNEGSFGKEGSFRATDGAAGPVVASSVVRRGTSSSRLSVFHKQNSHAAIKRHTPVGPVTATGTAPPRSDSSVEMQHLIRWNGIAMESNQVPAPVEASATFPGTKPGTTAWVQFTDQKRRFIKTGKVVGLFKDRKFRIHFDDGTEHTISSTDNSWLVYG